MSKNREAAHTELPIPNGWFAVAWAKDLAPGDVRSIRYFDQDLVLFRNREGEPRLLDAYCPHVGAHLGEGGRVMGDSIRCPFHGWQFSGTSGECVAIPYCDRIPKAAKVRAWHALERNEMIFAWHHAEGKPPSWDVPELTELQDPAWGAARTFELEIPVHMQELHENNLDPVHFQFVHGMTETPPSNIEYGDDGRYMKVFHSSEHDTPLGKITTTLVRDSWGLGMSAVRLEGVQDAGLLMFSSTGPVDEGNSHMRWIFSVTNNLADVMGEEFIAKLSEGVMQDFRIWSNKVHRTQPVLCEKDETLAEFRRWVKQFYTDEPYLPAAKSTSHAA